ncbi:MAG: hypothetical protein QOE71_3717 [Pseudonocardiales bacterium]|jgi:hypothetical protein|nr:hypothetical protein [Pseudonocardiales bacterium]MDQ1752661.1 hypothetical protein [Pseudonocardiales bacterium]
MGDSESSRQDASVLRIGNAEREQAVNLLGEHFASGRLDADEFDERVARAYRAKIEHDLQPLFADLPAPRPVRPVVPPARPAALHTRRSIVPVLILMVLIVATVGWVARERVPPLFIFPLIWLFWARRRSGTFPGRRR